MSALGVVVIGRDLGERLPKALSSLPGTAPALYVDSGSSDGSPERARALGGDVLELDPSRPFTAARARNEGWRWLSRRHPGLRFVQFLDGDCALLPGWLERAEAHLEAQPGLAGVAGALREESAERSLVARLLDMEWDQEAGPSSALAGVAVYRLAALEEVGGFDGDLPFGEESELCLKLLGHGWTLERLSTPMALHDAGFDDWLSWWQRAERAGAGYLEHVLRHGSRGQPGWARRCAACWFWALLLPGAAGALALPSGGLSAAAGAAAYGFLGTRIYRRTRARGRSRRDSLLRAGAGVLEKTPQLHGQIKHLARRLRAGRNSARMHACASPT